MPRLLLVFLCLGSCLLVLLLPISDHVPVAQEHGNLGFSETGSHAMAAGHSDEDTDHSDKHPDHESTSPDHGSSSSHHDHESHESHYTPHDITLGIFLMILLFVMAVLQWFLNCPDYMVRKVMWNLMNAAASVFLAVLTSNIFNAAMDGFFIRYFHFVIGKKHLGRLFCSSWYCCMFLALSLAAHLGWGKAKRDEIAHNKKTLQRRTNFMTTLTFMAHTAAFSSIGGWCSTLNEDKYLDSLTHSSNLIFIYVLETVSTLSFLAFLRFVITKYLLQDAQHDHLVEEWAELLAEGENDLFALVMSFLISDIIAFNVTGKQVMNTHGHETMESMQSHTVSQAGTVYLFSFSFLLSAFVYGIITTHCWVDAKPGKELSTIIPVLLEENKPLDKLITKVGKKATKSGCDTLQWLLKRRISVTFENTLIMTFAWLFMYATQWFIAAKHLYYHEGSPTAKDSQSALQMFVVLVSVSFVLVFVLMLTLISQQLDRCAILEHVKDSPSKKKGCAHSFATDVSQVLRQLMLGMGFLVGFTCEQSFNNSLGAIASHCKELFSVPPVITKFVLFVLTILIIYPAWAWYIVPWHREKGYLFGFVPSISARYVKKVLKKEDVDLSHEEKVKFLEAALIHLSTSLSEQEREKLVAKMQGGYQPPSGH